VLTGVKIDKTVKGATDEEKKEWIKVTDKALLELTESFPASSKTKREAPKDAESEIYEQE